MAAERTRTTAQATAEGLRIFVAGIPFNVDEDTLRRDFAECGVVEDVFVLREDSGRSRGRAFITFREPAAATAALAYNDTDYGGRKIAVKVAEARRRDAEKKEGAKGTKAPSGPGGAVAEAAREFPKEKPEGCRSLCLKNIGAATETQLRKFLEGCAMQSVRIVIDRKTGEPRGIAFIDFKRTEDVDTAMEKNGQELKGFKVDMHYEAPRERPRPEGCMSVAIKKLPAKAAEADVRRLFNGLKSLKDVRVIMNKERECTGLAFAEFNEPRDVELAVQRDGMKVKGDIIFICYETKGKKEDPAIERLKKERKQAKDNERKKKRKALKLQQGEDDDQEQAEEEEEEEEQDDDQAAAEKEDGPAEAPRTGKRKLEKRQRERARKREKAMKAKQPAAEAAAEEEEDGPAEAPRTGKRKLEKRQRERARKREKAMKAKQPAAEEAVAAAAGDEEQAKGAKKKKKRKLAEAAADAGAEQEAPEKPKKVPKRRAPP